MKFSNSRKKYFAEKKFKKLFLDIFDKINEKDKRWEESLVYLIRGPVLFSVKIVEKEKKENENKNKKTKIKPTFECLKMLNDYIFHLKPFT